MKGTAKITINDTTIAEGATSAIGKTLSEYKQDFNRVSIEFSSNSPITSGTFDYDILALYKLIETSSSIRSLSITVDTKCTFLAFANTDKLDATVRKSSSLTHANYPAMSASAATHIAKNKLRHEDKGDVIACLEELENCRRDISKLSDQHLEILAENLSEINAILKSYKQISKDSILTELATRNTGSTSSYALLMGIAALSASIAIKIPNFISVYASQIQDFNITSIEM